MLAHALAFNMQPSHKPEWPAFGPQRCGMSWAF